MDEYFSYPNARDCEKLDQASPMPNIDMDSSPHKLNKRMVFQDNSQQGETIMNKRPHIPFTKKLIPLSALMQSWAHKGCIMHRMRRVLKNHRYFQQIKTPKDSKSWIRTPNGDSNEEDSMEGNNWFDNICSDIERTKIIPDNRQRRSTGSRILSREKIGKN